MSNDGFMRGRLSVRRVVIDTNVYISGIFWGGLPRRILDFAREESYLVFTSADILDELYEKLMSRFRLKKEEARFFIFDVLTFARPVEVSERLKVVQADPDDDKFIECGVSCGADYLVSGDHHLTDLKAYRGIRILKIRDFLEELGLIP